MQIKGDARLFTNLLTCRDLTRCAVGQCKYAPLIDADGGIVNDPVLLRPEEDTFCLRSRTATQACGRARMGIRHGRGDLGSAHLPGPGAGPRAKDVVGSLFGDEVLEMPYYHCAHAALDGILVVLGRTGWTGEVGYEIYLLDPERGDDLWDRVMEAGAPHDIWPIAPCEPRRIEAGIFNYRSDMTLDDNPSR